MSRSAARRHCFVLIFQLPFHQPFSEDKSAETLAWLKAYYYDYLDTTPLDPRPSGRDDEYVNRVMWGTLEKQAQLDGVIENFLKGWEISRLNSVDIALLRLAIYEMLCEPDVPFGVAVNEAVELAKTYGNDDSPAFINGVLGNVAREIKGERRGE
ncbi:MAG: transcription antitermination factor NusB [Defluviitaleaceae bacterium]|nr:transcription antitermination factor NusB [Defluviitaleaceae bacterium]